MSVCPRCGATFGCGMADGVQEPCWCTQMPVLPADAYVTDQAEPAANSCFCPQCLGALLETTARPG